jgi:hypothetical protein
VNPRRSLPVAIVYALAFAWLLGKAAAFRALVPPGVPPDEPVHVSYVAYLEETGRFVPRYEDMRLLDAAGRPGPLNSNFAHPSAYYAVIGALEGLGRVGAGTDLASRTRRLRLASAPLFAAAAALFLFIGFRRDAPLAGHVVYAAAVATVPPLAFVGAAVSNDVLAFLSGGVVLLGLARWFEGRADALTGALIGAGLALALLSKATAGLLAVAATAGTLLLARRVVPPRKSGKLLLLALPWLLLPALHYVPVLLRYGTPIPSLDVVDPVAFARSDFVEAQGGALLSLAEWGFRMGKVFASTWLSIISHIWLPVGPAWSLAGPALLLLLAAAGLAAPAREEPERAGRALALVGAGAVLFTLLVNVDHARRAYLATGRLGGMHARYYLSFLPCLGLAAALGLRRLPAKSWLAAALAALLLLADARVTFRYLRLFVE